MNSKTLAVWAVGGVLLVVALVFLLSPTGGGGVEEASPDRIAELLDSGVRVIDVRTPGEFEMSHLPGAENVPMNELPAAAAQWDPSEPVIIYCTTGARSTQVVRLLEEQGFENVHHFTAGLIAWDGELAQGSEVAEMPADVVPTGTPVMYEFFTDW